MSDMGAQTYEDLNRAIAKLAGVISHARYTGNGSGMIPVDAMHDMVVEVANAYYTISRLWLSRPLSVRCRDAESISVPEELKARMDLSDAAINAANSYHLTTEDCEPPDGEPDW